jgi:tRNA(fMet)-specific endonuclease VapC
LILDTNALSAWRDKDENLRPVLERATVLVIPVIVVGEYRYGVLRLRYQRERAAAWLDQVLKSTRVAIVNQETADIYARIRARLQQIGRPIAPNDTWIAASAMQHGLPVLSRDADFDHVAGLTRISW